MIPITTQTKSALILSGTLLAGILLGALIIGTIVRFRLEQIADMRTDHGFVSRFEDDLRPADVKQQEAIRLILQRSAVRSNIIMSQFERTMTAHVDSVKKELRPLLTREQIERLDRRMQLPPHYGLKPSFIPPPQGFRKNRVPPPPGFFSPDTTRPPQ